MIDVDVMSGSSIDISVSKIDDDELLAWKSENLEKKSGDCSPNLSNYSSCEESDFERYCSANSVMGTPSVCSSVGNVTDLFGVADFGSLKNLGFGGEEFSLDSCDLWEDQESGLNAAGSRIAARDGDESIKESGFSSSRSLVDRSKSRRDFKLSLNGGARQKYYDEERRLSSMDERRNLISSIRNGSCRGDVVPDLAVNNVPQIPVSLEKDDEDSLFIREVNEYSGVVGSKVNTFQINDSSQHTKEEIDGAAYLSDAEEGTAFLSDVDEEEDTNIISSQLELVAAEKCDDSDDDGSMFDYGTDKEIDVHKYDDLNLKYKEEAKFDDENPLCLNSAVAFGSNDWDDFEQEVMDNSIDIASLLKVTADRSVTAKTAEGVDKIHVSAPHDNVKSELVSSDRKIFLLQNNIEAGCLEAFSSANGKFVEVGDGPGEMKSLCAPVTACTSKQINLTPKTDLVNPLSDISPGVSSSIASKVLQERVELVESTTVPNVCSRQVNSSGIADVSREYSGEPQKGYKSQEICEPGAISVIPDNENASGLKQNLSKGHLTVSQKVEKLETFGFYEEMVYDMEKVLLNSVEIKGPKYSLPESVSSFSQHQQFRDGGLTASTSGRDNANLSDTYPMKIDWIEVIGAKQLRGDVSLADRLIGVKEYTVYKIRVWSGREQWEVEHRYRDFFHLFRQLKAIYTERGKVLPLPWLKVERESRKVFGSASPTVVNERSVLIQDCLRSVLDLLSGSGVPNCVLWFLAPSKCLSSTSFANHSGSDTILRDTDNAINAITESQSSNVPILGNKISLIVDVPVFQPLNQVLEAQNYVCAGCRKHFDYRRSLMSNFVQTFGWGKPRVCEYTGKLFCVSCHTNETAVLPSRVLHNWDFTLYPVSQLAKSYLESIYDQPMLCVTAVNPLLLSKVPAIFHLMNMRKKIASMVQYVRCPFRRSIQTGMGSRRYLLESSEFFALRDLVDLSKGPFAALPVMMQNISRKILDHITQQCLVCCDAGIMCGSRRACEDPSSLIFPFQEDETERCKLCKSAFHRPCYMKLMSCPCGKPIEGRALPVKQKKSVSSNVLLGDSMLMAGKQTSESIVGYFSDIFSTAKSDKSGDKDKNPVILMGSMPSTSL